MTTNSIKQFKDRHYGKSVIHALILTILCYFANNFSIIVGEDLKQHFLTQAIVGKEFSYNDALFINVGYDKDIAFRIEDTLRRVAVTDRAKLYKLLSTLDSSRIYKYVILDVLFDKNDSTAYDDSLYNLIGRMDNIVFAQSNEIGVPRPFLEGKAALATFRSTIHETNFTRFNYKQEGDITIPLKIYQDLYPENKGLKKVGPFYFWNGKLAYKSCFIPFDHTTLDDDIVGQNNAQNSTIPIQSNHINMGEELLLSSQNNIIEVAAKDKYVIIGDFENDRHDTYMGLRPGSMIMYRALKILEEDRLQIKPLLTILWILIFAVISWFIGTGNSLLKMSNKTATSKLLNFFSGILSYTLILYLLCVLEFALTGNHRSLVIPFLYFTVMKLYNQYKLC